MNNNEYSIRNIDGKYYLYCGDAQVLTPEEAPICTASEELAKLLLRDAEEFGADTENVLSTLSYHSLYCDLLHQEEDEEGENIEMFNNLIHIDYFWAFYEPRTIRAAALSQYLDVLPKHVNDLPLHQNAAYVNLMAATGSIILPHKLVCMLLSETSRFSIENYDELVLALESYGQASGAAEDIDVDWTFDSIKKMVKTFITYYMLESV